MEQRRRLAFYKRDGSDFTNGEYKKLCDYVGCIKDSNLYKENTKGCIFDNGDTSRWFYNWSDTSNLSKCTPIYYEDIFKSDDVVDKQSSDKASDSLPSSSFWAKFNHDNTHKPKPLPDLNLDTKVLVWMDDDSNNKHRRHFSHFDEDGNIYCFNGGVTSWTDKGIDTFSWDNYEVVHDND